MRPTLAHLRLLLRGVLLLTLAWAAVVITATLLDDRGFHRRGVAVCATLENAHAVRQAGPAWPLSRSGPNAGDWTVRARYAYAVDGRRYGGTQVWPWGSTNGSDAVHEAAQDMRQQQRDRGCLRITVDAERPERAVVYPAPLRAVMQRRMWGIGVFFLAVLALELALSVWASRQQAPAGAAGREPRVGA